MEALDSEKQKEQKAKKKAAEVKRTERKKMRRKKKNALVICRNGSQFWTTQAQFWQWVREKNLVKTGNHPLRGALVKKNKELEVVIRGAVLNIACPNHLREVLHSRNYVS